MGYAGAFHRLSDGFSGFPGDSAYQLRKVLRYLAQYDDDVSGALRDMQVLVNPGFDFEIVGLAKTKTKKMLEELDAWEKRVFQGAFAALINNQVREQWVTGATSVEWVPERTRRGVRLAVPVRAEDIAIRLEEEGNVYEQIGVGPQAIALHPLTYRYIPLQTEGNSPYGIPFALPAMFGLDRKFSLLDSEKRVINLMAHSALISGSIPKPTPQELGLQNAADPQYLDKLGAYVNQVADLIMAGSENGLYLAPAVDKGAVELNAVPINQTGAGTKDIVLGNQHRIWNALGSPPYLRGELDTAAFAISRITFPMVQAVAENLWAPDGRYLPLHYGQTVDTPEAEPSRIEVDLLPKTFDLMVPVLDSVTLGGLVRVTDQSERGVPILSFKADGTLSYPVTFDTVSRFTSVPGARIGTRGSHGLISYGATGGMSVRFEDTDYIFDLFGTTEIIPEADGPLFDTVHTWGVTSTLPGIAYICLMSASTGFKVFGPYTLGNPVVLEHRYVEASLTGLLMPGASDFDLPYFGLVRTSISDLKRRMMAHHASLTSYGAITIPPAPYALELSLSPSSTSITAGNTKTVTATLTLSGGIPSTTEYVVEVENDEPGITVAVGQIEDSQDPETVAKLVSIVIGVTDSVSEGAHPLTVRAKAVGWVNDPEHPYYNVFGEAIHTVNASLYGPVPLVRSQSTRWSHALLHRSELPSGLSRLYARDQRHRCMAYLETGRPPL